MRLWRKEGKCLLLKKVVFVESSVVVGELLRDQD